MEFADFASRAVRAVERVPALVWAAWILGVVVATGLLALRLQPMS